MQPNPLRAKWAAGGTTFATSIVSGSPIVAQTMAHAGWDAIAIDVQHGAAHYDQAATMIAACGTTPTPVFVRVGSNDPAAIMKMLDAGALGIVCPAVESADDAARFVGACRYAPAGYRSVGPLGALPRFGEDYIEQANGNIVATAMIETRAGVERLDEILAVEGLDSIFVGPADLSLSQGWGHRFDAGRKEAMALVATIAEKTRARGRLPAIHVVDPATIPAMLEIGYQHIVVANDLRLLTGAVGKLLKELQS
ncbi:MAG TPA: aldolase/citrate lyase family protein [Alphaproteobacteria bacterium]|jgi:4-hydroxy-2-oxoheptanedioate aldolase|nr:aldolase/citrate lyase family protein [Alphaproteobacteria bacterium]